MTYWTYLAVCLRRVSCGFGELEAGCRETLQETLEVGSGELPLEGV